MSEASPRRYEILEHTADIGLRAWGETREALFEHCALGLAEVLDRQIAAGAADAVNRVPVELEASDVEALLVEWMNEVLFALENDEACLAAVRVQNVRERHLTAEVDVGLCSSVPEATELKAATYHQLSIRRGDTDWEATVYFDV